jgi:hypothetical protein
MYINIKLVFICDKSLIVLTDNYFVHLALAVLKGKAVLIVTHFSNVIWGS